MPLTPHPLRTLHLTAHSIPTHSNFPNTTPHNHPLLHYHACIPPSTAPNALEKHLRSNGAVPQWRYTMYSTSHYHSTTHEILCVLHGRAKLLFGGEANPGRVETVAEGGDVLIVPAGVAHRLLEDLDGGFEMLGCYPQGCEWDMCYGGEGEEDKADAVKGVEWLAQDPVYGEEGPVFWGREELEGKMREEGGGKDGKES